MHKIKAQQRTNIEKANEDREEDEIKAILKGTAARLSKLLITDYLSPVGKSVWPWLGKTT